MVIEALVAAAMTKPTNRNNQGTRQMTLLNTLKLTSTLITFAVVSLAILSPAFDLGIFLGGFVLGWCLLLWLETNR
jgi:hypothetical protein